MTKILIIDNYDSFVYNIAQFTGELGANVYVCRNDSITVNDIERMDVDGIILSPGPGTPSSPRYFGICGEVITTLGPSKPILGICLGHQGIAHVFGGRVVKASRPMHGKTSMIAHDGEGVFEGVRNPFRAVRYHSLVVKDLPSCLKATAYAIDDKEIMGIKHVSHPIEGVQFHPESVFTEDGKKILSNFLRVCRR